MIGTTVARAGYYKAIYSGGQYTYSYGGSAYPPVPYEQQGGNGGSSSDLCSAGYYGGQGNLPNHSGHTTALCTGTVTLTLQWRGDDANDLPPKVIVVRESMNVDASIPSLLQGTTRATTGESGQVIYTSDPPPAAYVRSGVAARLSRYKVRYDQPLTMSYTYEPEASAGLALGSYGLGSDYVLATVGLSINVQSASILLGGGITKNGVRRYLIGQRMEANPELPFYFGADTSFGIPATYQWSIDGGEPFKIFYVEYNGANQIMTSTGTKVPVDVVDRAKRQLACCFARRGLGSKDDSGDPRGEVKISCTIHVTLPEGSLPASGLDISLEKIIGIDNPRVDPITFVDGRVKIDGTKENGAFIKDGARISVGDNSEGSGGYPGFYYFSKVVTPNDYLRQVYNPSTQQFGADPPNDPDPGGWYWVQICSSQRTRVTNEGAHQRLFYGYDENDLFTAGLDTAFPYSPLAPPRENDPIPQGPVYSLPYPYDERPYFKAIDINDINGSGSASDTPGEFMQGDAASYDVGDDFEVWQMYRPPGVGSQFMPVRSFKWTWRGNAVWSGPSTGWVRGTGEWGQKHDTGRLVKNFISVVFPSWTRLINPSGGYSRYKNSP